jgi:hypothetical protein
MSKRRDCASPRHHNLARVRPGRVAGERSASPSLPGVARSSCSPPTPASPRSKPRPASTAGRSIAHLESALTVALRRSSVRLAGIGAQHPRRRTISRSGQGPPPRRIGLGTAGAFNLLHRGPPSPCPVDHRAGPRQAGVGRPDQHRRRSASSRAVPDEAAPGFPRSVPSGGDDLGRLSLSTPTTWASARWLRWCVQSACEPSSAAPGLPARATSRALPADARSVQAAQQALDVVEFDGHRLDVRLKVVVRDPLGFEQEFEIERIWLLVIVDVWSRAVLGYHVSLNREYSRYDVIRAIENALSPHRPRQFTLSWRGLRGGGRLPIRQAERSWATPPGSGSSSTTPRPTWPSDVQYALADFIGCFIDAGPCALAR